MTGASTMLASRDVSGGKQELTLDVPEKASAAADEGHDLEIVAILDSHVGERRARHDLHIAFHGDLGRLEAQLGGELRDRHSRRPPAVLAVDADRHGAVVVHVTPFAPPRRPPYTKRPSNR